MPPAPVPAPAGDWLAGLPEDLRQNAGLSKFTSGEALARSYLSLERLLPADKLALPRGPDDAEGWDRVHTALGRPDAADGYAWQAPAALPEGVAVDEGLLGLFRASAHKAGLSQRQFDGVAGMFLDYTAQATAAQQQAQGRALTDGEGLLRREWGERYDPNLRLARAAVREAGGDELVAYLDSSGLGNHPALIRAFARVGQQTGGEERLIGGRGDAAMAPADLDRAIAEFRNRNAGPLYDKMHPDHGRVVGELQGLYQRRYPDAPG